ncbi:hypothetical protein [Streptomyces sp. NPDC001274]
MEGAAGGDADGVVDDVAAGGVSAVARVSGAWARAWSGRAVPVGGAEGEGGATESGEERLVEIGATKSDRRAVNASQTKETVIATPTPTVTVPMSSAGDCFRPFVERRADLRTAGAGRDGRDSREDGEDGEEIPGTGFFSPNGPKELTGPTGPTGPIGLAEWTGSRESA